VARGEVLTPPMIQCSIVVIKPRNAPMGGPVPPDPEWPDGRRPLSARSVALSTLLGTSPPALPVNALVALGQLFGIAPGTMRTAISRMAATGELAADGTGRYRLVGRMLDRQAAQETGRRPPTEPWDGRWHWVVVQAEARSVAQRREFRTRMADHRFGELNPAVWLRPANLAGPAERGDDVLVARGELSNGDPVALSARLWDLDGWAAGSRHLIEELRAAVGSLAGGDQDAIPPNFVLSAAVLRHLRHDPLLPAELEPAGWPGATLRDEYAHFDDAFRERLQSFLRRHRQRFTSREGR
jgi:phenylacetic acid degradation operon negative regulatory protein